MVIWLEHPESLGQPELFAFPVAVGWGTQYTAGHDGTAVGWECQAGIRTVGNRILSGQHRRLAEC